MNYFEPKEAAFRYSKGRPYFHQHTIHLVSEKLGINEKLDKGLDIACGTGLSTVALSGIVTETYGTDPSAEMLFHAKHKDKIHYRRSFAEQQPFENNTFDIITVCSGVHWFDTDAFLAEANRLLKNKGWLVLYDNFFISEMEGNKEFDEWYTGRYLKAFPAPTRNNQYNWSAQHLGDKYFRNYTEQSFKNPVSFTQNDLVLYLTTQSNITAAVESGNITYDQVEAWLHHELCGFYSTTEESQTIRFGNWIKYIQKDYQRSH